MSRDFRRVGEDDSSSAAGLQRLDDLTVFVEDVVIRLSLRIDADDIGVVESLGRAPSRQQIIKSAVRGNKPLRHRAIHQQQ